MKTIKNSYIERTATQERPCFVCNKFTAVVLASSDPNDNDWFYVCRSHLSDTHFCSRPNTGSPTIPKSPQPEKAPVTDRKPESDSVTDLVSSIGSAWSSWRTKKEEKKDDEGKDKKEASTKDKNSSPSPSSPSLPAPSDPIKTPQRPPLFILHRDFFYLRQRELTKRQQKARPTENLARLDFPQVPTTLPSAQHK